MPKDKTEQVRQIIEKTMKATGGDLNAAAEIVRRKMKGG